MTVNDWCEVPQAENISMFSVNGVPYPLDEYLALRGEPTTEQTAKLITRWNMK